MVVKGPGFTNGIIILEEPEAVYYSGQLLSGNVHFELNETLVYSAINLTFLGEASVRWTETQYEMSGDQSLQREIQYEGREQYFNYMQCVSGAVGTSSLPPGVHSIPFQLQVPFNAPSSFKDENGIILYCITAYLEYPVPGRREELMKEFQVVAPLSSDILANMMHPVELDFEQIETCNCFCDNNLIDMKVALPASAFQVGGDIPVHVTALNKSSVEIYEICFKIIKRHTYRTQQPRSEYSAPEETLVEMKRGPVLSDTEREYTWDLPLPSVVLPNLEACSIMDVTYFFRVTIQMTGCNEPVEDELEIFIGVLPHDTSEASPDIVPHLPKAPVPKPNNLSIGLVAPSQNYPDNTQLPQGYNTVSTQPQNTHKTPCEIGFRVPTVPTHTPYPGSNMTTGYPPYPASPTPARGYPYPTGQPSYNLNPAQPNIITPSAPPM